MNDLKAIRSLVTAAIPCMLRPSSPIREISGLRSFHVSGS
jgi:hypothetical protein